MIDYPFSPIPLFYSAKLAALLTPAESFVLTFLASVAFSDPDARDSGGLRASIPDLSGGFVTPAGLRVDGCGLGVEPLRDVLQSLRDLGCLDYPDVKSGARLFRPATSEDGIRWPELRRRRDEFDAESRKRTAHASARRAEKIAAKLAASDPTPSCDDGLGTVSETGRPSCDDGVGTVELGGRPSCDDGLEGVPRPSSHDGVDSGGHRRTMGYRPSCDDGLPGTHDAVREIKELTPMPSGGPADPGTRSGGESASGEEPDPALKTGGAGSDKERADAAGGDARLEKPKSEGPPPEAPKRKATFNPLTWRVGAPHPEYVKTADRDLFPDFVETYRLYPRHCDPRDAWAAYVKKRRLDASDEFRAMILDSIRWKIKTGWREKDPDKIPYLSSYLNGDKFAEYLDHLDRAGKRDGPKRRGVVPVESALEREDRLRREKRDREREDAEAYRVLQAGPPPDEGEADRARAAARAAFGGDPPPNPGDTPGRGGYASHAQVPQIQETPQMGREQRR